MSCVLSLLACGTVGADQCCATDHHWVDRPTLVLLLPLSLLVLMTQAAASTTATRAKATMTVATSNVCFSLSLVAKSSFTAIQPTCGT